MLQDKYNVHVNALKQVKGAVDGKLKSLQIINQRVILTPGQFQQLIALHQDLQIQLKQLELLYHELQALTNVNYNPWYGRHCLFRPERPVFVLPHPVVLLCFCFFGGGALFGFVI